MRRALWLLTLAGCVSSPGGPLGSAGNPVRCDGKQGELAYLSRLRCPSGGTPHFHFEQRGPRGPYRNEIDQFELRCVLDDRSSHVFVDRHHREYVEQEPLPGFTLTTEAGDPIPRPLER